MVKLLQRYPNENILLFILLKNFPEQSGKELYHMPNIKQNYLFWNVPQVSKFFYLLLEFAHSFYWHEKECSRFFSKIPECSMIIFQFLDDKSFFLEKSYDKSKQIVYQQYLVSAISGSTETK